MPFYQSKGEIPKKRHTVFENPKGGIYYEELVSREGFSYMYSNLYHFNMPTQVMKLEEYKKFDKKYSYVKNDHKPFHFINDDLSKLLLYNKDVAISTFFIDRKEFSNKNIFHKNGDFDALIYIQEGNGILRTNYGDLDFYKGDYIVIPRGVIFQYDIKSKYIKGLAINSLGPIETPKKYRNRIGQLLEHAPFCERDIRTPILKEPIDEDGKFSVIVTFRDGAKTFVIKNILLMSLVGMAIIFLGY